MLEFFTGNDGTAVYHNPVMSKKRTLPDGWDTGCRSPFLLARYPGCNDVESDWSI
jgi:hypothetical protein